jgi:hypothetical protein
MLELEYSFTIETGPSYYSEQTDECFCSTDDIEYKYEINHNIRYFLKCKKQQRRN